MPQYEYQCTRCDDVLTKQFPVNNKPSIVLCPCGGKARSIISASNIHMKESIDPMTSKLNVMDQHHKDETGDDRDIEDNISNVDDDDLYGD